MKKLVLALIFISALVCFGKTKLGYDDLILMHDDIELEVLIGNTSMTCYPIEFNCTTYRINKDACIYVDRTHYVCYKDERK